jgi:nucleoside-diphosphate-sugar epimerase
MVFCFGYGYVAEKLGDSGTSRSPRETNQLLYTGGPFSKEIRDAIEQSQHILLSIPPDEEGDPLIPYVKQELSSFKHLEWLGYLSSTSVYGDHEGAWVDETSQTHPTSPQGIARLKAEHQWLTLDLPIHIFRLAGIYGPERNVLVELKAGRAKRIFKEGIVFSRIHVADIIQALKASILSPHPGRIYNLADNCPAPSHDVIAYGASLLGMDPPPLIPYEDAEISPMLRSFYTDSKRVKNDRLLKELIPSLLFPTYKEGLQDLIQESV